MKCEQCGAEFQSSGRGKRQRYCSKKCRNRADYLRRKSGIPSPDPHPMAKTTPVIDKNEFDRMMDGSMADILRHQRDVLQKAMDDPATRTSDLPALSRQIIAICEKLDSLSGGDLLFDEMGDSEEVADDIGTSIV